MLYFKIYRNNGPEQIIGVILQTWQQQQKYKAKSISVQAGILCAIPAVWGKGGKGSAGQGEVVNGGKG